ncbi:hypothetical protein [Micromonospora carbonacea]
MPKKTRHPVTGLRLIRRICTIAAVAWLAVFALGFCAAVTS